MALPKVNFIEAKFGESIVSVAARQVNPFLPAATGLIYTVAFAEHFSPGKAIRMISAALDASRLHADFNIHDGGLSLQIRGELIRWPGSYDGLRALQRRLKPLIPRTGIAYGAANARNGLDIQLSILGGFLPPDEIVKVRRALTAGGGHVTRVIRSDKLKTEVFFVSIPVNSMVALQQFLQGLRGSCGVYVTMQDH